MKKLLFSAFLLSLIPFSLQASTTHTIKLGDTLWAVSAKYYGDPELYPVLLKVNGITNPRVLSVGQVIVIPNKSDMQRIANESDPERQQELINKVNGGNNNSRDKEETNENLSKSPDAISRTQRRIKDPDSITLESIMEGPKVTADRLITVDENRR